MIIRQLLITKFRGFQNIHFQLGRSITIIAGQNGTQKTTLLGILSQPFSITDKSNPLSAEKPLSGGSFKSAFAEKFKLSETFDTPKSHEWTLILNRDEEHFTIESMIRDSSSKAIRFWKKGDRSKGSGYIQMPVIYLSLSRLFPIGEDDHIESSDEVKLNENESDFYKKWHNKILIIPDVSIIGADYLASNQKNTLGANTDFYDWRMNSAGQDNLGKILLAILSFKRLKEKYNGAYVGGILAIDELDATLYPASQIRLLDALRKFSSEYNIQIIATTHSLSILEHACNLNNDPHLLGQIRVVYLEKFDKKIKAIEDLSFETIKHKLNVTLDPSRKVTKIPTHTEDNEARIFLRALLKRKRGIKIRCSDNPIGCDTLIDLSKKKFPGFRFPDSLIILDGDVRSNPSRRKKIMKQSNILLLPGNKSPERLIADFLLKLSDESPVWDNIYSGYNKQICFSEHSHQEIEGDREKAKKWFKSQGQYWGRDCIKVINPWIEENRNDVNDFIESFDAIYAKYAKALSI